TECWAARVREGQQRHGCERRWNGRAPAAQSRRSDQSALDLARWGPSRLYGGLRRGDRDSRREHRRDERAQADDERGIRGAGELAARRDEDPVLTRRQHTLALDDRA